MVMKSSISFSKNTLFSQSVSSASISSVCRRIRQSSAGRRRSFPEFPGRFFAARRSGSGSPETHDLATVRLAGRAAFAESCRAVLRDAAAAPLPAIPRARSWRRSDTWLPPAEKLFHDIVLTCGRERGATRQAGKEMLRRGCRGGHKFIARDFRGNAHAAVFRGLDAHNFSQAADIDIARLRNLLRKNNDEFNFAADFEIGVGKKVEPAVTDIPRARVYLAVFGLPRQYAHGKAHCKSPRFAAFGSISHQSPLGC